LSASVQLEKMAPGWNAYRMLEGRRCTPIMDTEELVGRAVGDVQRTSSVSSRRIFNGSRSSLSAATVTLNVMQGRRSSSVDRSRYLPSSLYEKTRRMATSEQATASSKPPFPATTTLSNPSSPWASSRTSSPDRKLVQTTNTTSTSYISQTESCLYVGSFLPCSRPEHVSLTIGC
jgi:hypothetical protein